MAFHVVHNWRYIAKLTLIEDLYDHGYQLADARQSIGAGMSADLTAGPNESDQRSATPSDDRFDLDIYFILVRFLVDAEKMKMNNLKVWPLIAC